MQVLRNLPTTTGPSATDTEIDLLAKLALANAEPIWHDVVSDGAIYNFTVGYRYSVAIVSGDALFIRNDESSVTLPAGILLENLTTVRYAQVTAGASSKLVIEKFQA